MPNGGDIKNQLKIKHVTFKPALQNDLRFQGEKGRCKGASSRKDLYDNAWTKFLVDAYLSLLPSEAEKLELNAPEAKREYDKKHDGGWYRAQQENVDDNDDEEGSSSDDNDGNEDFERHFPNLLLDRDVWVAYEFDTHQFDLSKSYIRRRVRTAWSLANKCSGRGPPPDKVLANAMTEKRENYTKLLCSEMPAFVDWDLKEKSGARSVTSIQVNSPMERYKGVEDSKIGRPKLSFPKIRPPKDEKEAQLRKDTHRRLYQWRH